METQVKKMRERAGLTQKQLAEKLGTTQQSVYYYESGDRDIKASVLIELSRILGCSVSELLGIGGADVSVPDASDGSYIDVCLYGSIAAGTPIEMHEADGTHPVPRGVIDRYPDAFLLRVEGNSMNRVLPNGSFALIDPCDEVTADNKPHAVCVNGYSATIKRVRKLANGFELAPDSIDPTYKPVVYDYGVEGTETITVIGRVVWYCVPFDWEF